MIVPKAASLTPAQLAEVETIVGEFGCKILPIQGLHRRIYAIIGDERSETMVNRLLGLDYVDRVERMESVYKLLHRLGPLAHHQVQVAGVTVGEAPLIMAGQCTIDPRNPQTFLETAHAVKEAGAQVLRGGVWKPRTSPHSFQGSDDSLKILLQGKEATALPVITEVMEATQVRQAVAAGVDILQIGTRNALNYPLLAEVGRATAEKGTPILLKRGRHMGPLDEFLSAAEYIAAHGNPNILLCPRGTMPTLDGYRSHPDESITPLLREKTWAPVVADPSHAVGRSRYVPAAALAAIAYGADGLIIETHIRPLSGIGDDPQQSLTPSVLRQLIADVHALWPQSRRWRASLITA